MRDDLIYKIGAGEIKCVTVPMGGKTHQAQTRAFDSRITLLMGEDVTPENRA